LHRFFIPPDWVQGQEARLEGLQARQIDKVLRGRRGDRLTLLDDSGWEYLVEVLAVSDSIVQARVLERKPAPPEPCLNVTIYQGLLKGKKLDWVFQKGTEIGVTAFVPLLCDRCVALPSEERLGQRWASIVKEAAEQCGRGRLPRLFAPSPFRQACVNAAKPSFLLNELPGAPGFRDTLRRTLGNRPVQASIFVGPEGGFAPHEVSYAESCGILPVSLGTRIFRAETAGLVATTMLLYEFGDLG